MPSSTTPARTRSIAGAPLILTGVAVRDVARAVARGIPARLVSDAPAHLVADDEADIIVECMGGDEPAHTLIAAALSMGKSVVTANKHVIAHHGPALEAIARRTGASLRFEAAVGGGIPVLGPLASDLAADRVQRVRGIVNGTTNYILTAMTDPADPQDYADGPRRGPAPRLCGGRSRPGTWRGLDAVNKLVILARLAFDVWLDPAPIPTTPDADRPGVAGPGITTVSLADEREAMAADPDHPAPGDRRARRGWRDPCGGPPDGAAHRLAAGPNGGGAQSDRDRRDPGRPGRVRRPGRRRTGHLVVGPGRPDRLSRDGGSTWGPRPSATGPSGEPVDAPIRPTFTASSGIRYPIDD